MLKREFRRKYPCNPDEGPQSIPSILKNAIIDKTHVLYDHDKLNNKELRLKYCSVYGYDFNMYMKDWRTIDRINPVTKKFYKSKKYK